MQTLHQLYATDPKRLLFFPSDETVGLMQIESKLAGCVIDPQVDVMRPLMLGGSL